MTWRVVFRPEVEADVAQAAAWYDARQIGLGLRFAEAVFEVWDALAENPRINARRHPTKDLRWRHAARFPYRVVYEINEDQREVVVLAVLHAARHERHWQTRAGDAP
jgi:plasmid stabilization system protein ParE